MYYMLILTIMLCALSLFTEILPNLYYHKIRGINNIFFYLFALLMIILSILRCNIGTDYNVYYNHFLQMNFDKFNESLPYIFASIYKISYSLDFPFHLTIVICALCALIPLTKLIYQYNERYKLFGLALFVGLGYYALSYNFFRQFAAIGLAYIALQNFYNKKKLRFIIFTFLAIGFHSTIIPVILIGVILYFWNPGKEVYFITSLSLVIFILIPITFWIDILKNIIQLFKNIPRLSSYAVSTDQDFMARIYDMNTPFFTKISFIPLICFATKMICDKKYCLKKLKREQYQFLKLYYFYTVINCMKLGSEIVTRLLLTFSICGIFAIPMIGEYIYCSCSSSSKKRWLAFLVLLVMIVFALYGIYFMYTQIANNSGGVYPYQTWL